MLVALASAVTLGLTAATGVSFNITTTLVSTVMCCCNYYAYTHSCLAHISNRCCQIGVDNMFVFGDEFFEVEYHMGHGVGIRTLLSTTMHMLFVQASH